ncbi:MAG: hypothetical protein LBS69_01005, partial [Prevotellaceae bacterium]|nr:hypothetical protein [Prevotellaceae bacterium]
MKILKLHNKNKPYLKGILSGLLICFLYFQPLKVYGEDMDAKKARSVFSALDSIGNFYDRLNAASLRNLPAGVKRTLGNVEYSIAISGVKYITGDYAELTIYGRIQIPQGELFFGAQGIKFSHDGDFKDDCELLLLHDMTIPVNGNQTALILHGGFDQITGQLKKMTYFSMDCSGFKELSVVADIVFSDSLIRKVNEKGEPVIGKDAKGEPLGRVSCPFTTVIRDWNDIFVSISMPRFEINGLDGFIFDIKNAVFDFSDSQNEQNIVFPRDYVSNYLISGNINTWRGVYIRELSLVLPRQFAEQNSDRRISFSAQNMLIDNNGISGSFAGENILPIDRGSAGGWRFSVNRFSLDIETNQLTGARFSGAIGLPVSEISTLNYEAFISPGNEYQLKVSSVNDFNFDIWKAKATINANSYIQLKVIDGKFRPEAILNGSLSVSVNSLAKIDDIRFTEMHLQTVAPYFSVKSLGCEGDVSLKGFPLSVSKIALTTVNKEARLGFDAKLSLAGDKTSIAAKTRLEIVSSVEESGKWKYQKLDVTKIILDSVTIAGAFSLNGSLILLNDDPVYGDGFAGEIDLDIKKGIELGVRVRAIFGNKDYRYWLVDGLAEFPGILVFPPAVKLNGFGGGAYYRMKPSGTSSMPTKSGYIPDSNYGLGLKAALLFNIGKKGLVDGESSFEIAFNKNGGINFISFYGQAKFLGEIPGSNNSADFVANKFKEEAKKEADFVGNNAGKLQDMENMKGNDPNKAAQELFPATEKLGSAGLLAAMGIQYDFTNNTLHSTFDIYVNAVNGMLKGIGSGNKAGGAVFHVEPGKWYLHLGTPTNQMGVEFNIANLVSMKTQSYFMAGHDIPGSPPPPQAVADILGVELSKLDYMRDLNA